MKLYHGEQPLTTDAAVEILAKEVGLDIMVAEIVLDLLRGGQEVDVQSFYESDRQGVIAILSAVHAEDEYDRSQALGDVREVAVEVEDDFDKCALVAVTGQAVASLSEHFDLTPDKGWVVRDGALPSLEVCQDAVISAIRMHNSSAAIQDYSAWTLGNLVTLAEEIHGENFSYAPLRDATGFTAAHLNNCAYMWKWSQRNRRFALSMSCHRAIARTPKIGDMEKVLLLEVAEKHAMSTTQCYKIMKTHTSIMEREHCSSLAAAERISNMQPEEIIDMMTPRAKDSHTYLIGNHGRFYTVTCDKDKVPKAQIAVRLNTHEARAIFVYRKGKRVRKVLDWNTFQRESYKDLVKRDRACEWPDDDDYRKHK